MQRLYSRAGFERAAKVCQHFTSDRYARHSESRKLHEAARKRAYGLFISRNLPTVQAAALETL